MGNVSCSFPAVQAEERLELILGRDSSAAIYDSLSTDVEAKKSKQVSTQSWMKRNEPSSSGIAASIQDAIERGRKSESAWIPQFRAAGTASYKGYSLKFRLYLSTKWR